MRRAALVACLALPGCYSLPSLEPVDSRASVAARAAGPRVTPGGELVAYLARIRDLDDKALASETQRQREAARAGKSDLEAVKLGLALSLAPPADEGEIVLLLDPVARRVLLGPRTQRRDQRAVSKAQRRGEGQICTVGPRLGAAQEARRNDAHVRLLGELDRQAGT